MMVAVRVASSGGGGAPRRKLADFGAFPCISDCRRRRRAPRASERLCQRWSVFHVARLHAGAQLWPACWPRRSSSSQCKLSPFIRAAAAGRIRLAESSTSLFDQLGVTSFTGTLHASSAQRILCRAAALLEKWAAAQEGQGALFFPWSWRPPRSSTGKTKVVGLVELSMPAPLDYADYDGISIH